jgi:hypothetical protein
VSAPNADELEALYTEIGTVIATPMADDARDALRAFLTAFRSHRLAGDKGAVSGMAALAAALEAYPAARAAMETLAVPEAVSTTVETNAAEPDAPAAADVATQSDATNEGAPSARESAEFAYPVHPAAAIFPMMSQQDLAALADDIKINGLREPIVVFEGRKVDGRNREAACLLAGVEPRYREWSGEGSVVAWVLSVNLRRRHLTDQQRAMVAARAKDAFAAEAEERRLANLLQNKGSTDSANWRSREPVQAESGKAAAAAAAQLGVSTRAVERAAAVIEKGDTALLDAVTAGAVSLGAAATVAQLPHEEQKKLVEHGEVKAKAAAMRKAKKQKRDAAKKDSKPKPGAEGGPAAPGEQPSSDVNADGPPPPPSPPGAGDEGVPKSDGPANARLNAIEKALRNYVRAGQAICDLVPERAIVSTYRILEAFVSGMMDRPIADDPETMRETIESTARALLAEPKGRARARPTTDAA